MGEYRKLIIDKNSYENQKIIRYKYCNEIINIYRDVLKFSEERGLILTGGKAIDFYLRGFGYKLYDKLDNDYDFYSTDNFNDAYNLTDSLSSKYGDDFIHTIQGMHRTVARVRYRYNGVADITYIPQNIFDKIPIFIYNNIKIVSPGWQMLDQIKAFSLPFENAPLENIISRWEKDTKRFLLLSNYFDVDKLNKPIKPNKKVKLNMQIYDNVAIGGEFALNYWTKNNSEYVSEPIIVYSDFPNKFCEENKAKNIVYHNKIISKVDRFIKCKINDIEHIIIDNMYSKISAIRYNNYYIASIPVISLYHGTIGILYESSYDINLFISAYKYLVNNIEECLILSTYGSVNIAEFIINTIDKHCENITNKHNKIQRYNYYPNKKSAKPIINYDIFSEDGKPCDKWDDSDIPNSCVNVLNLFEYQFGVTTEVFDHIGKIIRAE